jgi:KDO2-lipid IV(A) lauroyltransferase
MTRLLGVKRAPGFVGAVMRRLGRLSPKNRIGARNIAAAFPQLPGAERRRILAGSWDNLGRNAIEFFLMEELVEGFRPDAPEASAITINGLREAYALRDSGKPAVVFTGHLANGEILAAVFTRIGIPLTILFRPFDNPFIGAFVQERRQALAGEWVTSARDLGLALRRGRTVVVSIDHRTPGAPILPFLGRPAYCSDIVARLAHTFDCPVYSARGVRQPGGRLHIDFAGPLDMPRDAADRIDVAAANAMMHGTIEAWVREHPDQYLWQHGRWRLRPPHRPLVENRTAV